MLPHLVPVTVGLGGEPERTVPAFEWLLASVGEDVSLERRLPGELTGAERARNLMGGGGVGALLLLFAVGVAVAVILVLQFLVQIAIPVRR